MKKIVIALFSLVLISGFFAVPTANAASTPAYDYELITQSPYPATLTPGQIVNVWIEVKNTGTATWQALQNTPAYIATGAVRLGTGSAYGNSNQQRDYASEFENSGNWISNNRPTYISPMEIRPGWHTRFQFDIKAPLTPGDYKAYFTPVVEGVTWMKDIGIFWAIKVVAPSCVGEGGSLGAVVPGNNVECCSGLVPYVPFQLVGGRGTCKVSLTPTGQTPSIVSLVFAPEGPTTIKSGDITYFSVGALYDNWTTQNVTTMATLSVVYDTGTGVIDPDGRFIAGSIGTAKVRASFNGLTADSGVITITGIQ